ncbi:MAG: type I secretion C-terminal target domain-containing protein, partial [Rhodobacterales bacterium]|nr:type I secretion C-terminal target domain-containing protein [Rhodobacterales bacterium]
VQATSASGNVITDANASGEVDDKGSEGASLSIWNGTEFVDVPASGTTVTGSYGTLEISSNGSYTYTPNANINNDGEQDSFTYKLTQPDGDSDTAQLTIDIVQLPVAPIVNVQESNSLLGIIGVEALNLIDFGAHQALTAFDANNNLQSVTITTSGLAELGIDLNGVNKPMSISEQLASELGLKVTYEQSGLNINPLGIISLNVLGSYSIKIEAVDGGEIDNQAINELLGTVEFNSAVLADAGILNSTTITATDTTGLSDTDTVGNLINANLLDNTTEENGIYEGTVSDDALTGTNDADRLYGFEGNDTLNGGAGNDLLRGGEGNDILDGGAGDDLLYGGMGDDILTGGDGADRFVIAGGNEGHTTTITDYDATEGDVLDLSEVITGQINPDDLGQYLDIAFNDQDGSATLTIDSDGDGDVATGTVSQTTVVLQNFDQGDQLQVQIDDLKVDYHND